MLCDFFSQFGGRRETPLQHNERFDNFTPYPIRRSERCCLRYGWMPSQSVFDFDGRNRITVTFDDIILDAQVIYVPISIHATEVAREIVPAAKAEAFVRGFSFVMIAGESM
jgi:hypothetical protein